MNNKKIAFTTLGCKVNSYDTEAMMELFVKDGYEVVKFEDFADVYVINTCTVTNLGDKKSRQMLRRSKRINPNAIVVATGCYSQTSPEEVAKIDGINVVIGTKNRKEIVETVNNYTNKNGVLNKVTDIMREFTFEPLSVTTLKDRTRAFLKIQEGCNRFCTFCIIPFARGPIRSREPKDVLEEVNKLVQNGFKEVVLAGIHVASYGNDLKDKDINLAKIVEMVHKVDGVKRIRFSSIEPLIITDEFINTMKSLPKVCPHYHLSLQSGCDKTLKSMNRRYTVSEYREAVFKLREAFPDVNVTTDVIVGFPNETDEDFEECLRFIKDIKISNVHAFPYSPKKGTKASIMDNQIPNNIKNDRNKELIKLASELNRGFLENFIGKELEVLFETLDENGLFQGYTRNYINVKVNNNEDLFNKIVKVKIEKLYGENTLFGNII